MAADEEIAGHEIAGEEVNPTPILPPTTDPADTDDAYGEVEYAGDNPPLGPDKDYIPADAYTIVGDTCDAYAEIEYAGECVNEEAVFQSLPGSSVEDFETSAGRLGCGAPSVFITTRCSSSMTCQLDMKDITHLRWTRALNAVSEAEVEIGLTGDSTQTCCACLSIVEPYCHELHIWRDGEEVWVGPIEGVRYERERVTIKAGDSLSWLNVRIPEDDVEFKTTLSGNTLVDNPLLATSTIITSTNFASLPAVALEVPATFIMLDPNEFWGPPEIVKVVTHGAGANTITVLRGQSGTKARHHNINTVWEYGGLSGPTTDVINIAKFIIWDALEEDISFGNSCEYSGIYAVRTGEETDWYSEGFNQTSLEILTDLSELAVNFTTLGRTIVLTGDAFSLTPLILLNDEHIMGEIEVTKDGSQMVNRQYVHFDGDGGVPGIGQKEVDERFCYSLIERITNGDGIQAADTADQMAQAIVDEAYICPRIVEIPEGSRLSPDTPWTINQMVPGAKVDVAITRMCLTLTQSFLLTGVSVDYSDEGEAIGITLKPMNSTTDSF